ncbi:MAG: hypothetical protein AB7F43_03065 [Bacteriovoracia bacterium]
MQRALILIVIAEVLLCKFSFGRTRNQIRSASEVGITTALFAGPETKYLTPAYSGGFDFAYMWVDGNILWASKFSLVGLFNGTDFGGTGSPYHGAAMLYRFQPRFIIRNTDEGFIPYASTGLILGGFGLFLTDLTLSEASNNQASFKYGYTVGVGALVASRKLNGIAIGLDFFQFLPTPLFFQFKNSRQEALGIQVTFSLIYGD